MENNMTPILYILMRNDLASMNPGKAVAQGSHATSLFEKEMTSREIAGEPSDRENIEAFQQWSEEAEGFGTTIVLGCTGRELKSRIIEAKEAGAVSGITVDPTYPLKDGEYTHLIPLETCGYIFGDRDKVRSLVSGLSLLA